MKSKGVMFFAIGGFASSVLMMFSSCQDQGSNFSFDHVSASAYGRQVEEDFDSLLERYVDSNRFVRYRTWLGVSQDVAKLKAVLEAMSKADESVMSADQKKAFYINAYNAMTLDLVLSRYEETLGGQESPRPGVRSIRNIGNLDSRVWDHPQWKIAGKPRSLNDVENQILRPMGDARIHFAIVCASVGCPPIPNHAFAADALDGTLDRLADEFVNSGRHTSFDHDARIVHTSQILSWFRKDFVGTFGSVSAFFSRYVRAVDPGVIGSYAIKYGNYDWTLNESIPEPDSSPSPISTPPPGSSTEREIGSTSGATGGNER